MTNGNYIDKIKKNKGMMIKKERRMGYDIVRDERTKKRIRILL